MAYIHFDIDLSGVGISYILFQGHYIFHLMMTKLFLPLLFYSILCQLR